MAPVTFHGGPLHGHTVDSDGSGAPLPGAYRIDGLSAMWTADPVPVEAHAATGGDELVRPALLADEQVRPARRTVTRR